MCADLSNILPEGDPPAGYNEDKIETTWREATGKFNRKIIVLDDDPTGTQTVAGIPVYTSWDRKTLKKIMEDNSQLIYILTNSRALTAAETEELHRQLGRGLAEIFAEKSREFLIISRSDSTLRGHYPLETEILAFEVYQGNIDGEIIIPFFQEGGRVTYQDIHYVKEGDQLIPAGETQYAGDTTFGYRSSNLKDWIAEKSGQRYRADDVISITLDELRGFKLKEIVTKLNSLNNGGKAIVNSVNYLDLMVFTIALLKILERKNFIFRTAASFVRVVGGLDSRPLLTAEQLYLNKKDNYKGLIIVGSYVEKTNRQLDKFKELAEKTCFIEWRVEEVETETRALAEVNRVVEQVEEAFNQGKSICIYTTRGYYSTARRRESAKVIKGVNKGKRDDVKRKGASGVPGNENDLIYSVRISRALVAVVKKLAIKPDYIIAKGGITSSDIGVKALGIKRAEVIGQILPGVPVWRADRESRFPEIPYVIFPGNVGDESSLQKTVEKMSIPEFE